MAENPLVAVIMGSKSDWDAMRQADETLTQFGVAHECRVLSAHRTPAQTAEYVSQARNARDGSDHCGGRRSRAPGGRLRRSHDAAGVGCADGKRPLKGLDSLLSTVQMPAGIPVGTLAIGAPGARNAALLAVAILAGSRPELREKLRQFRTEQSDKVLRETL